MLGFCPDGGAEKWRVCPLQEKGGRTFGVLLSGCLGCDVRAEWLLEMAKLGGQMLEKVWRREQLETLIRSRRRASTIHLYTYIPIYLYTYIPIYLYTYIPIYETLIKVSQASLPQLNHIPSAPLYTYLLYT